MTTLSQAQTEERIIDTSGSDSNGVVQLQLEELIADEGQLELDLSFGLTSRSDDGVIAVYEMIDLGGGRFVTVPTSFSVREVESDTLISTAVLRYGLTERLELSMSGSFAGRDERELVARRLANHSKSLAFNSLAAGVAYQFSEDNATPALIGFTNIALVEAIDASGDNYALGRSLSAGFTSYRVLDPVVLTVTGGYQFAAERGVGGRSVDPGDVLFLSPGVSFVANDDVTLTAGIHLRRILADRIDGETVGADRTRAAIELGMGYRASEALTIRASARSDVVGNDGFTALFSLSYQLGKDK